MRSGDWALRVPGQRWAVALVWKTWKSGFGFAVVSGVTHYLPQLEDSKKAAAEIWRVKTERAR